jgi:hypothetical protein
MQEVCGDEINVYIFEAGRLAILVLNRKRELKVDMVTGVLAVHCEAAFVARRGLAALVYMRMGGAFACCATQYRFGSSGSCLWVRYCGASWMECVVGGLIQVYM